MHSNVKYLNENLFEKLPMWLAVKYLCLKHRIKPNYDKLAMIQQQLAAPICITAASISQVSASYSINSTAGLHKHQSKATKRITFSYC